MKTGSQNSGVSSQNKSGIKNGNNIAVRRTDNKDLNHDF